MDSASGTHAVRSSLPGILVLVFAVVIIYPHLPDLTIITDYQPRVPLRVYSAEGLLIGEFGEERRAVVKIDAVPSLCANQSWRRRTSASTSMAASITRRPARCVVQFHVRWRAPGCEHDHDAGSAQFFPDQGKNRHRKFNEMLLAFKIEHSLSKDQILELYINQIYLGQRAYGFAAAAQIYFGKSLDQLTIAEMAMLAGLPKAPSSFNPVVNPKRAKLRQQYVLRRMRELDFITDEQWQAADKQTLVVKKHPERFRRQSRALCGNGAPGHVTSAIRTTSIRAAFGFIRPCRRRTRTPPTRLCARA